MNPYVGRFFCGLALMATIVGCGESTTSSPEGGQDLKTEATPVPQPKRPEKTKVKITESAPVVSKSSSNVQAVTTMARPKQVVALVEAPQPADPSMNQLPRDAELRSVFAAKIERYGRIADPSERSDVVTDVAFLANEGMPKDEVAQALGKLFESETDADVKADILDELAMLEDSTAFNEILRGVQRNQPLAVREAAISALDTLGDTRAIPVLEKMLSDPDPSIREAADEAYKNMSVR